MTAKHTAATFWARVKRGKANKCWNWTGAVNSSGYGIISWHGRVYVAHRIAAWLNGLVRAPEAPRDRRGGGFVLHTCDNPKCCNPKHFTIGTYSKNLSEAYERDRKQQPRGSGHVNAKLTDSAVRVIRKQYAKGGIKQKDLGREYGVSQRAISLVVRHETYRNVSC